MEFVHMVALGLQLAARQGGQLLPQVQIAGALASRLDGHTVAMLCFHRFGFLLLQTVETEVVSRKKGIFSQSLYHRWRLTAVPLARRQRTHIPCAVLREVAHHEVVVHYGVLCIETGLPSVKVGQRIVAHSIVAERGIMGYLFERLGRECGEMDFFHRC